MEKKLFKNESAQRIVNILRWRSLVSFEVFLKKGKTKILNEESTAFENIAGRYCSRDMFESAFLEYEINKDGAMEGWYEATAILAYNEAQCSHPETGQNDFDAYWDVDHIEFTFIGKTRKEILAARKASGAYYDLPF